MNEETLLRKGWARQEARRTSYILATAHEAKTPILKFFDSLVYWTALGIAILGNFVLSIVLIPFLLILSGLSLYFALLLIGLAFGALLDFLLRIIERIGRQDIIAEIFIPAIALINVYIMTNLANVLALKIQLPLGVHNPLLVSVTYVIAFTLPHFFFKFAARHK